jgi:hypothetical protein
MGLKGYRLWVMGQLDSNVQSPTSGKFPGHRAVTPGRQIGLMDWTGLAVTTGCLITSCCFACKITR